MLPALDRLGIGLQAEPLSAQQPRHRVSPVFHARVRYPLEPPASAVISSCRAPGYRSFPSTPHQQRIDSTANAAVS